MERKGIKDGKKKVEMKREGMEERRTSWRKEGRKNGKQG